MNPRPLSRVTVLCISALIVGGPSTEGYEKYSNNDDATNCRACHGDFRSSNYISPVDGQNWGNLHNIHRSTMLGGDCDVCHIGDDRLPVYLNSSDGGDGFEPVGCMGCHGVDPAPGEPNNAWWGAGLRLHHANANVGPDSNGFTCMTCHTDDPPPPPESAMPSYYFTPDSNHSSKPTDPCNLPPGFSETFAGAVMGLDNDGDLAYDDADLDCAAETPTPTATSTPTPTQTPTLTPTPTIVITNTPTATATATPIPPIIFGDDFESGDTSEWSSVAARIAASLDRAQLLGRTPLTGGTVFLVIFAGATLAGLPGIRRRRERRQRDGR
ncbi:MAG: hypothetical protein P8127_07065 [Acidobacteriota bacterium]